jgi:hypothetical protein
MFLTPADTFDNVKGQFPIGFKIWNTNKKEIFTNVISDIYDKNATFIGTKGLFSLSKDQYINKFISIYKTTNENNIGFMDGINGNDFQHNNIVYILNTKEQLPNPRGIWINKNNLIPVAIYFSVRKAIQANWLNDRDQFLNPNKNKKIVAPSMWFGPRGPRNYEDIYESNWTVLEVKYENGWLS